MQCPVCFIHFVCEYVDKEGGIKASEEIGRKALEHAKDCGLSPALSPQDDGVALFSKRHSRSSILGASLELESIFPDMPVEEINRASILLADAFEREKKETTP